MCLAGWGTAAHAGQRGIHHLRFNDDGGFRIVQFTDTQDDEDIDARTVQLIEAVLDNQTPDLVVLIGDNITDGCDTVDDVRVAIKNIVQPVDEGHIPWLVTFGNYDEDQTSKTGLDEAAMLEIYMSYL